jgi:hypothetical protein
VAPAISNSDEVNHLAAVIHKGVTGQSAVPAEENPKKAGESG